MSGFVYGSVDDTTKLVFYGDLPALRLVKHLGTVLRQRVTATAPTSNICSNLLQLQQHCLSVYTQELFISKPSRNPLFGKIFTGRLDSTM